MTKQPSSQEIEFLTKIYSGIITIAAIKGGVGKTTIIHNLVIEYSKTQKVNVIDLDKNKSLSTGLAVREELMPEKMKNINIIHVNDVHELVEAMQKNVEEDGLMFIDQGGFDLEINRIATAGADILFTAMSDSFYELSGFKRFSNILEEINQEFRLEHNQELAANVVICGIHPLTGNSSICNLRDFVDKEKNFSTIKTPIRTFDAFAKCPGTGENVIEYDPRSSAAENFIQFKIDVDNLLEKINIE